MAANRPALALLLIALLATQGVLASPPKLTDTDQSNRKLMAAQKADIVPALIAAGKAAWKGVVFLGKAGSAVSGIVKGAEAVNRVIDGTALAPPPGSARTVTAVACNGPCAPPPPAARPSVNGCDNEGCLCQALGPGVHPNVFDNTCASFFHCPGPKRPCGPGTLFHPDHRTCDWPANVKCVAVTSI